MWNDKYKVDKDKAIAFMKAVRALENAHGLYIETSEDLSVVTEKPEPRSGVFAAADTVAEMEALDKVTMIRDF